MIMTGETEVLGDESVLLADHKSNKDVKHKIGIAVMGIVIKTIKTSG
jgi:hypothetical protein